MLVSLLPTGRAAAKLDTAVGFYSTQLIMVLAGVLAGVMGGDEGSGGGLLGFLMLVGGGGLIPGEGEEVEGGVLGLEERLEAGAGT